MSRSLLVTAVLALALATPASAKWVDRATITGPGLDAPIVAGGEVLFDSSGFYSATFAQSPGHAAPRTKQLGPRYTVTHIVPGPTGHPVRQDLYPYAAGGPVTYMKAGQPFVDGLQTQGGWYAAPADLKETLVALGLPRVAPAASRRGTQRVWILAPLGALFLAALPLVACRPRA
jgi:hypothetical protein